jgi:hypothetical protein
LPALCAGLGVAFALWPGVLAPGEADVVARGCCFL